MKKLTALCAALALTAWASPALATQMSITEFLNVGNAGGNFQQPLEVAMTPPVVDQGSVNFSGGATQSAAFNTSTRYVRLVCDVQCSVAFGANPTATTSNMVLPAGLPEYFGVIAGQKVSVIANPGF